MSLRRAALVAAAAAVVALAPAPGDDRADARPTATIDCSVADTRIEVTADAELDPSCTYTAGIDVTASDVTLDCRGARIASAPGAGGRGIEVRTPVDVAMSGVTVRNCRVEGFLNSLRVTRDGFRDLAPGEEFLTPTSDIAIEDSTFSGSRGVGVYVDGWVSGVTIAGNTIRGAGSSGIYLEGGSRENVVVDNDIVDNGFVENGPGGRRITIGGTDVWFWGVGREGISVDGSSANLIEGNRFAGNSAGGVFLYKNCGEYPDSGRYFDRRDPSNGNVIRANAFDGGRYGVWVASRMGENTLPMECTDPAYVDDGVRRVVLDHAEDNTVADNTFSQVTYGVVVEDDGTTVAGNRFTADGPDHHAVIVGTPDRTEVLGRPVTGTVLRGNEADIVGNDSPYRWVHGIEDTTDEANLALGEPSSLCEGEPLPRLPFIFTIAAAPAPADGSAPPTPDLTVETLGALPSCRTAAPAGPTEPAAPTAPAARPVAGQAAYTG